MILKMSRKITNENTAQSHLNFVNKIFSYTKKQRGMNFITDIKKLKAKKLFIPISPLYPFYPAPPYLLYTPLILAPNLLLLHNTYLHR